MTRVQFEFVDTALEGEVVAERPAYRYNDPRRTILSVDVDGRRYRVLERDTRPA